MDNQSELPVRPTVDPATTAQASPLESSKNLISSNKLTEAGVHIGLQTKHWNPAMKPYIRGRKGNSHIIDLATTIKQLEKAYAVLVDVTNKGGKILYVGTKGSLVKAQVREQAKRAQGNYVTQRWLGGTLTNFKMVSGSIRRLNDLVMLDKTQGIAKYTKKEQILMRKEIEKLIKFVGGIRTMRAMPQVILIVDPKVEYNTVQEAKKMGIMTIGLSSTNGSPSDVDIMIPCNTNSLRSITLLLQLLTDAACESRGEPLLVAHKPDDQIILVEDPRPQRGRTSHRSFNRFPRKDGMPPRPYGPKPFGAPATAPSTGGGSDAASAPRPPVGTPYKPR